MKTTRILWAFALGVFLTGTLTSCKKNQKEISQQEFQQMLDDAEKKGEEKAKKEMQQQTQEEQAAKDKQQVKEPGQVVTAGKNGNMEVKKFDIAACAKKYGIPMSKVESHNTN